MPIIEMTKDKLCAEASDLNWEPGKWPLTFNGQDGAVWTFSRLVEDKGETLCAKYHDLRRRELTVWND